MTTRLPNPSQHLTLGEATDLLNQKLTDAEAYLTNLNLGVTAEVDLPGVDDFTLRFGKYDNAWRLIAAHWPGDSDLVNEAPLVNANRRVRLAAVAALEALRLKLFDAVREEKANVLKACADVDGWLAARRNS